MSLKNVVIQLRLSRVPKAIEWGSDLRRFVRRKLGPFGFRLEAGSTPERREILNRDPSESGVFARGWVEEDDLDLIIAHPLVAFVEEVKPIVPGPNDGWSQPGDSQWHHQIAEDLYDDEPPGGFASGPGPFRFPFNLLVSVATFAAYLFFQPVMRARSYLYSRLG
jgi:hypothetical protein